MMAYQDLAMRGRLKTWLLIVAGATLGAGAVALIDLPGPGDTPVVIKAPDPTTPDSDSTPSPITTTRGDADPVMTAVMLSVRAQRELGQGNFNTALKLARNGRALLEQHPPIDQRSAAWQIYTLKIEARILEKMGRIHEIEAIRREVSMRRIAYYEMYMNKIRISKDVKITVEDVDILDSQTINMGKSKRSLDGIPFPDDDGIPRLRMCTNEFLDAVICRSGEG